VISRFAPSTTGEAHPGTLLSAQMIADLAWLGLDWDETISQLDRRADHEAALDRLAAAGRLYPCKCTRADRVAGIYQNTCRDRGPIDWRKTKEPVRLRLDDGRVELRDDSGLELSQTPAIEAGDPVVRRRDGVIAYQLVVVVDDAASGVTRIVRGRDIAPSTATQVVIQRQLGVPTPAYRHHLLLLEPRGDKLAKLHGSVTATTLRSRYRADELCGILACGVGLRDRPDPCRPAELVGEFAWDRVTDADRICTWTDHLEIS